MNHKLHYDITRDCILIDVFDAEITTELTSSITPFRVKRDNEKVFVLLHRVDFTLHHIMVNNYQEFTTI